MCCRVLGVHRVPRPHAESRVHRRPRGRSCPPIPRLVRTNGVHPARPEATTQRLGGPTSAWQPLAQPWAASDARSSSDLLHTPRGGDPFLPPSAPQCTSPPLEVGAPAVVPAEQPQERQGLSPSPASERFLTSSGNRRAARARRRSRPLFACRTWSAPRPSKRGGMSPSTLPVGRIGRWSG